ncbi:MAG: hypothetical protein V1882_07645 [Candidatus Omnitrophota bacterium]
MQWHLLRNELKAMLQFHKSVLLLILKALLCTFRYGLWLLPWIFLAVFVWKPVLTGWKAFNQGTPDPGWVRQAPFSASPYGSAPESEKSFGWETIPNKVDSGMRTVERISKQIRKK